MIKLFITDIDGCLLEPFKTPDWEVLQQIKELNSRSGDDPAVPPLTLCTGRPMPYAEATAQWMDIRQPIVFESAGIFQLDGYRVTVNGSFTGEAEREVGALKQWLKREIITQYEGMTAEFSKLMDAGLIHPDESVIREALPRVRAHVEEHHEAFEVHWTEVSINVILKGNNKETGIRSLCEMQQIDPAEAAYIGDSSGDIPGLRVVGRPFAPANASEAVKQVAEVIPEQTSRAVLEAYRQVIKGNSEF